MLLRTSTGRTWRSFTNIINFSSVRQAASLSSFQYLSKPYPTCSFSSSSSSPFDHHSKKQKKKQHPEHSQPTAHATITTTTTTTPTPTSSIPDLSFLEKIKGTGISSPPRLPLNKIIASSVSALLGASLLSFSHFYGLELLDINGTMLIGSFGASCALLFAAPDLPVSQPRNIIGGHMVSAFVGVTCYELIAVPFGAPLACPISIAGAICGMLLTKTFHPPAAGNGIVYILGSPLLHSLGYGFMVLPCMIGPSLLVMVGLITNNGKNQRYPKFWW